LATLTVHPNKINFSIMICGERTSVVRFRTVHQTLITVFAVCTAIP